MMVNMSVTVFWWVVMLYDLYFFKEGKLADNREGEVCEYIL
jgi:hypothetical protein